MSAGRTTVVIIGAGQAGLAMSRCLTDRSIDHVVLERGDVANAWRTERWDSLRLLTPNWLTRLPSWSYAGDDPDGYMTAAEVARMLVDYRRSFEAPVVAGTEVTMVRPAGERFVVTTTNGTWTSDAVVVATGAAGTPNLPPVATALPHSVDQLTPIRYRNPAQLDDGAVLVVGGSASGVQIADELARSGRRVTISVGDHVRVPRTYRGMDIHWWMDTIGQLDERIGDVGDVGRARRLPSLQLVGSPERRAVDLNALVGVGVSVVGRTVGVRGDRVQFSGSLANFVRSADLKQERLLDRIDEYVCDHGLTHEVDAPDRPAPTQLPTPDLDLDLRAVRTVIWATGFRPRYPWLDDAFLDERGSIRHVDGVAAVPGAYVLGLTFLRRRKSNFIDGVGPDAEELSAHLAAHLGRARSRAPLAAVPERS
ncbi:MAG: NAD(P)-binding domain-containing protein [Ilumatobacter sp.]|nr:NAD(P)-binding domain-containing protein [Ilumatobacter sp.]